MIVQSEDKAKLIFYSKKLADDNKKVNDQWVPTGTQSMMFSYTFLTEFGEEFKLSSKSEEYAKFVGQDVFIQLKVSQFGMKKPECKFVGLVPIKK